MADGSTPTPRARRAKAPTTPDPIEIAMEAEAHDDSPDSPARRLLLDQGRLVRWQIAGARASFGLKLLTGIAVLCAAGALGAMAWSASQTRGLALSAIDAPPDMAQRGLTGKVLAEKLQDRLRRLQNETANYSQGIDVRTDGPDQIRIDIPQTGLSLNDIEELLRRWLGHTIAVSGGLTYASGADPNGALTLAVRVGDRPAREVSQTDGDINALLLRGAEGVYADIDPIGFAQWLEQHGRSEEAVALMRRTANSGSDVDRAVAYVRLGEFEPDDEKRLVAYKASARLDGGIAGSLNDAVTLWRLGRSQASLEAVQRAYAFRKRERQSRPVTMAALLPGLWRSYFLGDAAAGLAPYCEDFRLATCSAVALAEAMAVTRSDSAANDRRRESRAAETARVVAAGHDTASAARILALPRPDLSQRSPYYQVWVARDWLEAELEVVLRRRDWPGVIGTVDAMDALAAGGLVRVSAPPRAARVVALANLRRFPEADAARAKLPPDCDPCLLAHAWTAEIKGDRAAADRWFALASARAPSLPQADADWGRALLARGEPDAAIARLKRARARSPHFADPLQTWGEALMAKGDLGGAERKFAAASAAAPGWGRPQLKWAQALAAAGKAERGRAHRALAARLDLTAAERAELAALRI